jgi:LytTr DNA-binding domain
MGLCVSGKRLPLAKREMQDARFRAAPVASPAWWGGFIRIMAVGVAVSAFLALTGAMETIQWPLWRRFAYWTPLMMLTTPVAVVWHPISERIERFLPQPLMLWVVTSALVALPITLIVWAYTRVFNGWPLHLDILPFFYGPTLTVTLAMVGIGMLLERPGTVTHAAAPVQGVAPSPVRAKFLDRLTAKLMGGTLYAIKAEDHYLRLYTSKGEDLILMRLSDALLELEGLEGAQTHRSWWVAKEAVQSVQREDGKVALVLPGGISAPVSRANVKPLREAGWV